MPQRQPKARMSIRVPTRLQAQVRTAVAIIQAKDPSYSMARFVCDALDHYLLALGPLFGWGQRPEVPSRPPKLAPGARPKAILHEGLDP